jgi:glutathione S-transferase
MLELYQFEMSHYVEKVRLILDYKELEYRKIEVTPGLGQLELVRMSGQRQVPILKDGDVVIADSTAIAEYLEKHYPEKPILPADPKQRGLCLLMEQWADASIGLNARTCLVAAIGSDQSLRTAVLPAKVPDFFKTLVGSVPGDVFSFLGFGVGLGPDVVKSAHDSIRRDLEALCFILLEQPYLVTDHPTLADFAVAGLSMYLKFPEGNYLDIPDALKGKGISGIADLGTFEPFFTWRRNLYSDYRKPLLSSTTPTSGPTAIAID